MNKKNLLQKLNQAQTLLTECVEILEQKDAEPRKVSKKRSAKNRRQQSKRVEDLSPPIQGLIQSGFFKEAKIDLEVVSELQRKLLTKKKPLRASVVNVLRKFVRKGVLDRIEITKDKKTLIAYKNNS